MSKQYRVLAGNHTQDGVVYKKGEVIETDHDLKKLFPLKFRVVGGGSDEEDEVPAPKNRKKAPLVVEDPKGTEGGGLDPEDEIPDAPKAPKTIAAKKNKWDGKTRR